MHFWHFNEDTSIDSANGNTLICLNRLLQIELIQTQLQQKRVVMHTT